jgi:hypothetical protein
VPCIGCQPLCGGGGGGGGGGENGFQRVGAGVGVRWGAGCGVRVPFFGASPHLQASLRSTGQILSKVSALVFVCICL